MMDVEISDIYSNRQNEVLLMAVKSGNLSLFKALLKTGADVNCLDKYKKMAPIHFAVEYGHNYPGEAMLKMLLEDPKTDINISDGDGNSPLHQATRDGNYRFVNLLLNSNGVNANQRNRSGIPPAYLSTLPGAVNGFEILTAFLRSSDVDFEMTIHNKKLKEVIDEKHPGLMPFKYLYAYDEIGFISRIPSLNQKTGYDGQYSYLQYACAYGLKNVVRVLLEHGFDPNEFCPNPDVLYKYCKKDDIFMFYHYKYYPYPLFMAAFYGYAEIIQLFLDIKNLNIIYQSNKTDERLLNTSALHLVIEGSTMQLLAHNPGLCDYDMSFKILLPRCSSLDIDFADYRGDTCLHSAANAKNQNYIHQLLNHGASLGKRNKSEESPLEDIDVDTMRSYLDSCIHLNDECSKDDFEIEFSYEFLYSSRSHKTKNISETNQLMFISEFTQHRSLLQHPVLYTIINSKWYKILRFYYYNMWFYLSFLFVVTAYILFSHIESLKNYLMFMVLPWLIIFSLREFFQFTESPKKYVSKYENWLDIGIIIGSSNLLWKIYFKNEVSSHNDRNPSIFVIIIFFIKLIFLMGTFSKFAVPFAMFKLVSKTFFKFLLCYSLLIITFILSFYELFKDNEKGSLENLFTWSFKTIVMLNGEIDSSSLPFSKNEIVGRLVFLVFVFSISTVLNNLLNGLAVSDTQKIQNDAKIIVIMADLHFIHSFEIASTRNYVQNISRYLNSLLGTRFFDLNCILFPDSKSLKLKIYPYRYKMVCKEYCVVDLQGSVVYIPNKIRNSIKYTYNEDFPVFLVHFNIINEEIKKIKSVPDNSSKNNEIDVNILIEEIKEIKQMLNSITQKINN